MCGIAGIYFKHEVSADTLSRISDFFASALRHRGPDHYGAHIGSNFVYANLRLAIVDRAGGNQPIFSPDAGSGIVYNGEVYNWETLRESLESKGYPFKSHTDTESILAAYLAYGDAVFEQLNGMFAACLWSAGGNSFVLVRDRFGSKPLYVYEDDNFIAFASEIKILLGLPNIDTSLNPYAFQDYLTYRYTLAPHTFFKRIEKLPAGHILKFDGYHSHKRAFVDLRIEEPENRRDAASYIEELDFHLEKSVRSQLMGEVPIGLLLSGGLDSSTIAHYLNKNGVKLKAFSIGFPEINEFEFSREVARHFDLDYQEVCLTQVELFDGMDQNILRLDEPIADPACFALSRLCEDIRRDVTVVLSGEGGDELFAGYNQYLNALNPEFDRDTCFAYYFYQSSNYADANTWLKNKTLPPEHLRYRHLFDTADTALNGMLRFDWHTWMPENLMMKADKILMAHSLEGRYPFLDVDLFQFAATLPQEMKLPNGHARKHILVELMKNKLPKSVVERRKMGFAVPPIFFLQKLQSRFIATLHDLRNQPIAEILDLEAIKGLVNAFYSGQPVPAFKIWSLFVLVDWFARAYPAFRQSSLLVADIGNITSFSSNDSVAKISAAEQPSQRPKKQQGENIVLCDGGLSNRLNALIFCLILRKKYGHSWEISWPRNTWCGASFHKLFSTDMPVHEHAITHYKHNEESYKFIFHENQCDFNEDLITYHSSVTGYDDYERLINQSDNIVYFNNLIPDYVTLSDIKNALEALVISPDIYRKAAKFCRDHNIDENVLGLHIRKTDFGDKVDDNALYSLVKDSQFRFFVCSDDANVNSRFSQLPNCCVFIKHNFPEKVINDEGWNTWTSDNEGRHFPYNITRPEGSILEALIDLLILSKTTLVKTSNSTFFGLAGIFKATDFFKPTLKKHIFLDCGSNLGQGFEHFSGVYKNDFEYILFEPNPYCYNILVEKYGEREDVKIRNVAVFNEECHKIFSFSSKYDVGGSLIVEHNSAYPRDLAENENTETQCINLIDQINMLHYEDSDRNIILKLDIESSEYDVLESMIESGTIFFVKKIYCEFHSQYMDHDNKAIFYKRELAILDFCKKYAIPFEIWH